MAAEIFAVASELTVVVVVVATTAPAVAFEVAAEVELAVASAAVAVTEPQGCYNSAVAAVEGGKGEFQEAESDMWRGRTQVVLPPISLLRMD